MKKSKIAILAILLAVIVMAAPASAFITSQNTETKAEKMVAIATNAQEAVMDLWARVEANTTMVDMILAADLDEQFYGNISLCVEAGTEVNGTTVTVDGEGWAYLVAANQSLNDDDYEAAIENAREALEIFRDVLRAINGTLVDAGIETEQVLDAQLIQEAIDRSRDRIEQLQALLADEELLGNLTDAEDLLDEAQVALDLGEIGDAKDALMEANSIISYVCNQLKQIAQELNPQRIGQYIGKAYQYLERFRERFGDTWMEDIDFGAILEEFGYSSEEEFMAQFQEIIQNAQGAEDIKEAIKDLKDVGHLIKKIDSALTKAFGNKGGNGQGQGQSMPGNGNGFGNMGGGNSP